MLPLAAALAVLCGQTSQLDLVGTVRLGTQVRSPYVGDNPKAPAVVDLDATPSLSASLERSGGRILLSYAPTFRVREPYDSYRRFEAHQAEYFYAQWFREGRPRPYLSQSLSFGTVDWASLFTGGENAGSAFPGGVIPGGTLGGVTPVTQQPLLSAPQQKGTFNELLVDINGGVTWPVSRRVSLDTSGGFTGGGGSDVPSQIVEPLMMLGRGRAQLDVAVDPRNTLAARSELFYVDFAKGPTVLAVFTELDATGRWRRQLSPSINLESVAGGSALRAWPGGSPRPTWLAVPILQGILSTRFATGAHAVAFDATIGASPFIDRFAAQVYERFDTAGTLLYTYRDVWQLGVRGGVGQSLQPVQGANITTTFIEGRAGYVPPRIWRIDLTAANSAAVYGTGLLNTWLVALAVTFRAEGMF